jgi:pimeloyl-ACP methyl ester carboxylesterase
MEAWAAVVPGSTTQLIPGAGHYVQETHPQQAVDLLMSRIREE